MPTINQLCRFGRRIAKKNQTALLLKDVLSNAVFAQGYLPRRRKNLIRPLERWLVLRRHPGLKLRYILLVKGIICKSTHWFWSKGKNS